MSQPFTEEQFDELRAEFDAKAVSDILEEMQNWTDLPRRVSAFLTCRSWLRKRQTKNNNQSHANNRINRPAGAAVRQYGNYGEGTI